MSDLSPTPVLSQDEAQAKVIQLDTEMARLGKIQGELMQLMLENARKHSEIDEEFAPRVNALLFELQNRFDSIAALADELRGNILPRGKKSADRLAGNCAWRDKTTIEYLIDDDQLVRRIQGMGRQYSIPLLRTVPSRVLDGNAIKLKTNRKLVDNVEGIAVHDSENFTATPSGGFPMSTSHDLRKFEGMPLPEVWETILRSAQE